MQSLEMADCVFVSTSPDQPNIFYEVCTRTDVETDMSDLLESVRQLKSMAPRAIVYCRSLNVCADLYVHFHHCAAKTPASLMLSNL